MPVGVKNDHHGYLESPLGLGAVRGMITLGLEPRTYRLKGGCSTN